MQTYEDYKIIKKIAEGNIEAFEDLFLKYQPKLVNFLTGLTHDHEISRDIAQDLFLSIWKERGKLNSIHSFSSYLFQMARFKVYDYFDHLIVSQKYTNEYLLAHSDSTCEEETLFVTELQSIINKTISRMSPQRALVYRMSREEGLLNEEIAQHLGISKRTVENHLTAALSALRKAIYILFI